MFNLTYTQKCPTQGILYFYDVPFWRGLSVYKDIFGVDWDIKGIFCQQGEVYIWACPLCCLDGYYRDTLPIEAHAGRLIRQQWMPYKAETALTPVYYRSTNVYRQNKRS